MVSISNEEIMKKMLLFFPLILVILLFAKE